MRWGGGGVTGGYAKRGGEAGKGVGGGGGGGGGSWDMSEGVEMNVTVRVTFSPLLSVCLSLPQPLNSPPPPPLL